MRVLDSAQATWLPLRLLTVVGAFDGALEAPPAILPFALMVLCDVLDTLVET